MRLYGRPPILLSYCCALWLLCLRRRRRSRQTRCEVGSKRRRRRHPRPGRPITGVDLRASWLPIRISASWCSCPL